MGSLVEMFKLNKELNIDDINQLNRIQKKMDAIIHSKALSNERGKFQDNQEEVFIEKLNNQNKIEMPILKKEIKNNLIVGSLSLINYLFFTKISPHFKTVNSIGYYKQIFLFTFCICPLTISLYFSKLNLKI
jgi:hypothetical protein